MKKTLFICLTVLLFVSVSLAQPAPLITNVNGRSTISLNGQWNTIIDPMHRGDKMKYYRNRKPKDKTVRIEYDFDTSPTLAVPGDWNTQRPSLFFYEGPVWYKKSFDYQKKPDTRVFVYFGAAFYEATAWLNRKELGYHEGGFTPFNFEITDKLRPKNNYLVVKVNNQRRKESVPALDYDFWNYGGLTRSVYLIELPQTFIQDYFIQLKKGSRKDIAGWVKLNGPNLKQNITIEIPQANIKKTFATDENGLAKVNFSSANLQLWTPENPKLYQVKITAETDAVTDRIGFRTIETKGQDILLNGKPVFLRGICIHEEAPYRGGRAYSMDDAMVLLGWAKQLNCNYVRLAHYPHNENMVRLADEVGLLVWSEVPLWQKIQFEDPHTLANAKNQLTEQITRDKNRACIILWSVGNETDVTEPRMKFMKELITLVRTLDPTRLVTLAMHKPDREENKMITTDPLGEYIDVLAQNQYIAWYGKDSPETIKSITWETPYNKPFIMSEFGAGALYGNHGDPRARWTEEHQELLYTYHIEMVKKIPFLRGVSPWILMDFRSSRRPLPYIQDYWNRKGVISNYGQKKKAFYVLQKFYEELKNKK